MSNYAPYHWCVVSECKNSSVKTRDKLWIQVPVDINMRNTWLKVARRDPELLSHKSRLYFCEDHFDLEHDMENYIKYKIMGSVKRIKIKPNCIPSRFAWNNESHPTEAKRQRVALPEDSDHDYKEAENNEVPSYTEDEAMPQTDNNETEVKISCRSIKIGSYHYKPTGTVRISSEGVSIPAPRLTDGLEVSVNIPLKSIVHVLMSMDVISLHMEARAGAKVQGALHMSPQTGPYFDSMSPEESINSIALLPASLARRQAAALRTLFGMVLDEPGASDARHRAARASVAKHERVPSTEHQESPPPSPNNELTLGIGPGPESPHKSSASSSSSVIFPPSPAPISLSSHSSPSSPNSAKSSPTRKRKSRGKKSKNKKMKYVLVKNPEPNAVDAFLAGVAPILKSLSPVLLNLAKSEIITAALKYERNMLTDSCIGNGHSPNRFP